MVVKRPLVLVLALAGPTAHVLAGDRDLAESAEWFERAVELATAKDLPCPAPPPIAPFQFPSEGSRRAALEAFQESAAEYGARVEMGARPCPTAKPARPGAAPAKPPHPRPPIGPFKLLEDYRLDLEEFREGAESLRTEAEAKRSGGELTPDEYRAALGIYADGLVIYRRGMVAYGARADQGKQ